MTSFQGELGLQFTTHIAHHYSVPELVEKAALAHSCGFDQVWVNDNLNHRNIFVVLAAMAAQVPIKLGTAILVPYFRNPVDLAGSIPSISELTDGREFSVGIARGAVAIAGRAVQRS
jgi:alkanesulfonate monooxygenase SsuD/methylene tetrahydromethanopterin reductase-like flavin-dependent oxidoreductase (luciferase family)